MVENSPPRSRTFNWRQLVEQADPDWHYERHHPVIRRLPSGREMRLVGGAYDWVDPSPDTDIVPPPGALTIQGLAPSLLINKDYTPAAAALAVTGNTPVLTTLFNLEPGPDSIVVSGLAPVLTHQQAQNISPPAGTVAITGLQPDRTFGPNIQVNPDTRALAIQGWAPNVSIQLQGTVFITPVNVTPGTAGAWTDVDVSAQVPASATGVILEMENVSEVDAYDFGLRKKGSSDNRVGKFYLGGSSVGMTGLDASRIFQAYIESTLSQRIYLVGYFTGEAVFFDNGVSKLPAGTSGWQTIDISSNTSVDIGGDIREDIAIGAIFEVSTNTATLNFRKMGSSDNRPKRIYQKGWFIIGVDSIEQCEVYRASSLFSGCHLIGYIRSHWRFNTNAIPLVHPGPDATFVDLPALSNGAIGGAIEINTPSSSDFYGLRENGSADSDIDSTLNTLAVRLIKCDGSRLVEAYRTSSDDTFYEIGVALNIASLNIGLSPAPDALVITGLAPSISTTSANINLSPATATLTLTGLAPSLPWNFGSDFETDETTLLSGLPYFDNEQIENGTGTGAAVDIVTTAITGMSGNKMRADAPLGNGKALWNADLIENYNEGDIVEIGCVFRFDTGETLTGAGAFATIFDLENGAGSNPGIRVGVNSSKWTVNRGKLSLPNYNPDVAVNVGQTYTIELKMRLSTGASGITKFYVDGVLIVDETGQNLHADGYDRTQWGCTVNNTGDSLLRVFVDRVWFRTLESTAQL